MKNKLRFQFDINPDYIELDLTCDDIVRYRLEANFFIEINNELFWGEECHSVIEFAIALKKWYDKGMQTDFHFETISSELPSILDICKVGDKWYFDSVWRELDVRDILFTEQEICEELKTFFKQIDMTLLAIANRSLMYYIT